MLVENLKSLISKLRVYKDEVFIKDIMFYRNFEELEVSMKRLEHNEKNDLKFSKPHLIKSHNNVAGSKEYKGRSEANIPIREISGKT